MSLETLADLLLRSSAAFASNPFLEDERQALTYAEATAQASSRRTGLRELGVTRGDRVVIIDRDALDSALWILGCILGGFVFIVLHASTRDASLEAVVADAEPAAVIDTSHSLDGISPTLRSYKPSLPVDHLASTVGVCAAGKESDAEADVVGTDIACLVYTSGSTGTPKGIICPHSSVLAALTSINAFLEHTPADKIGSAIPLSFDYGLYQLLLAMISGASITFLPRPCPPPRLLAELRERGVTGFPAMRALLVGITRQRNTDLPSLRYLTSTGDYLPEDLVVTVQQRFSGAQFYSMYGLSECKRALVMDPRRLHSKPTSVGRAIPGTRARVVDEAGRELPAGEVGELAIEGPHVMRGYWRAPEETRSRFIPTETRGTVLMTGDLFRQDSDGDLHFVARNVDVIKSGGFRLSPQMVERAICQSAPSVRECIVYGIPDPVLGEALGADVTISDEQTTEDILAACRRRLEPQMVPRELRILEELPKSASGKYIRRRAEI